MFASCVPRHYVILLLTLVIDTLSSHMQEGTVYAVEFSHRSGRDLIEMAKRRTNIVPIIEDARHPLKYRMLVGTVDTIFADVAQPDQSRIVVSSLFPHHGHASNV